jgi:Dyp-type peroxidase family
MSLLEKTNVSLKDGQFQNLLNNLQGNIIKHHGRTHAYHIFIQFDKSKSEIAKKWIKSFTNNQITSAAKQLGDASKRKNEPEFDGGVFCNLSLAHTGYVNLGLTTKAPSSDAPFIAGLKESKDKLQDDFANWEAPFLNTIDALIIVADNNVSNADDTKNEIIKELDEFSTIVAVQKGKILRNANGIGIEHFGYADGVSQPNFLANNDSPATQWDDNGAKLGTLLIKDSGTSVEDSYGSFYVFRKLEQNVRAFKKAEKDLPQVKDHSGEKNAELAGAMVVGRFEDGSEVINNSGEKGIIHPSQLTNDFDYRDDMQGSKCPFHSHIRVTNPRADVGQDFAKSVRLTRRGIPYNDIGRDEFNLEEDQPTGGVGLLFQCYQSSIEKQFEFIQHNWANQGDIGGHIVGQDAIIGQGDNGTVKKLPKQWGLSPLNRKPVDFGHFVTTKGGEYFFTPSISFLRNI